MNNSNQITVNGVGGCGKNIVNYMYKQGIQNVNLITCADCADNETLEKSAESVKSYCARVKRFFAAFRKRGVKRIDRPDEIRKMLAGGVKIAFIIAGIGRGTGTGVAPVIAHTAKEMGILTVALVTIPFQFEGRQRLNQAMEGVDKLKECADALLVFSNNKLRDIYGDLKLGEAFGKVNDAIDTFIKRIVEIIIRPGAVKIDFDDVCATLKDGGMTVAGTATVAGENRAREAVQEALKMSLFESSDISGARRILLKITTATDDNKLKTSELGEITDYVSSIAKNASLI
jgi:cell division protein FtsZ